MYLVLKSKARKRVEAPLAQLVERESHNLKFASSILAGSNPLLLSLPRSRSPHPTPCSHRIFAFAVKYIGEKAIFEKAATMVDDRL